MPKPDYFRVDKNPVEIIFSGLDKLFLSLVKSANLLNKRGGDLI
jgi:hypothetical protein